MMTTSYQHGTSKLSALCAGVLNVAVDVQVSGLSLDSRTVSQGGIFFALRGSKIDGLRYARTAIERGAVAIIHETQADELTQQVARQRNVVMLHDPELKLHMGVIASRFFGESAKRLKVIGITGTDGKSSVSHFLAQALTELHKKQNTGRCAVVGTLGNGFLDTLDYATHTTPNSIELHAMFSHLESQKAKYIAMEVSSIGLDQQRVSGIEFDVAVLTNLGRDHLDYHESVSAYRDAKRRLFKTPGLKSAVVNIDDEFGRELVESNAGVIEMSAFGMNKTVLERCADIADWVSVEDVGFDENGFTVSICVPGEQVTVGCALLGRFNVMNVLAVVAVLRQLGFVMSDIVAVISELHSVNGRMQLTRMQECPTIVVDYSHTPQALAGALTALRPHCSGKLWCVFGCGGDRDKGKRPEMGRVAEMLADKVVVTDDNPRSEKPKEIVRQILDGMSDPQRVQCIHDRRHAIVTSIMNAGVDDVILIAGKGHETVQIIGDEQLPFSDQAVVNDVLKQYPSREL